MSSLSQVLLDPAKRPQVVASLSSVVDEEVAGKGGLSGAALKTAFGAAKKAKADLVPKALDRLLPDFAAKLDPFWAAKGEQPFGAYLTSRKGEVSDELLAVADAKVEAYDNAGIKKAYGAIRGKASGYVEESLPRVGAAIEGLMA